jgi:hypothetical protein
MIHQPHQAQQNQRLGVEALAFLGRFSVAVSGAGLARAAQRRDPPTVVLGFGILAHSFAGIDIGLAKWRLPFSGEGDMDALFSDGILAVGGFRFDPGTHRLYSQDAAGAWAPVPLGPRAREIFLVLLKNSGAVVSRDAIMTSVWPGVAVEPNNLRPSQTWGCKRGRMEDRGRVEWNGG